MGLSCTISNYYRIFDDFLNQKLRPNPKYTPDPADQDIGLIRNKGVALLHIFCAFVFALDILLTPSSAMICIFRIFVCFFIVTTLQLSCQYHPLIFRIIFMLNCSMFGPLVMNTAREAVLDAWLMSAIVPVLHYILMGSFTYFLGLVIFNVILNNTLFYSRMQEVLNFMPSDELVQCMNQSIKQAFICVMIIVLLMKYQLSKTAQRVVSTEKRRVEAESQKTFLFSFSHELRNLIHSLTGNVKLAKMDTHIPERSQELLSNAEACGELLLYLVNNILDTGKAEASELEVDLRPTDIYKSLEKIWGICSELIRRRDLRGRMMIQKDLPRVLMTDQYRITQIFINLIGNAVKFTERGSINITVEWLNNCDSVTNKCFEPYPFNEEDDTDEGLFEKHQIFTVLGNRFMPLDLSNRKVDDSFVNSSRHAEKGVLKIAITDTGCGMNKEQTVRLFHKFTQVTEDASKRKLGTGLGLFIIKQICQKMGGEARVFSKQDRGSCFIFCIPVTKAASV